MKLTRLNDLVEDGEVLKGNWELLPGHELGYRGEGRDQEIRFKAPLIAAEPTALVAALTARQDDQTVVTRLIKLTGRWKTDGKDRLVFEAERARGRTDRITLNGTWKLNDSNEIIYTYRSELPLTARRTGPAARSARQKDHQILFKGHWEITGKKQISYLLEGSSDSAFRFRGTFQTPSILAKKGEVRFQIGAEASGRHNIRTVTFFGSWKISRDLALRFELDEGPARRKRVWRYGAEWTVPRIGTLAAQLKDEDGKPLGAELVWTRSFMTARGEGELFARIERFVDGSAVEAGGRLRW